MDSSSKRRNTSARSKTCKVSQAGSRRSTKTQTNQKPKQKQQSPQEEENLGRAFTRICFKDIQSFLQAFRVIFGAFLLTPAIVACIWAFLQTKDIQFIDYAMAGCAMVMGISLPKIAKTLLPHKRV